MNKMNDNYVKELIQVAAVALAAAQTFMYGNSSMEDAENKLRVSKLLNDVYAEREAQEAKWGVRTEQDSPPEHWLTIMMEEVGEVADEIMSKDELIIGTYKALITQHISALGSRARAVLDNYRI